MSCQTLFCLGTRYVPNTERRNVYPQYVPNAGSSVDPLPLSIDLSRRHVPYSPSCDLLITAFHLCFSSQNQPMVDGDFECPRRECSDGLTNIVTQGGCGVAQCAL
eukprot:2167979-Prymnesium_polylepis.1